MFNKGRVSNYDKTPTIDVHHHDADGGYEAIVKRLKARQAQTIVVDCYPGVDSDEIIDAISDGLGIDMLIRSEAIFFSGDTIQALTQRFLTDDRVRGSMYYGKFNDFIDLEALKRIQERVANASGNVLICGVGAALITKGDVLVYADITRWEIQLRYRQGMPNFKQTNTDDDILKKYKRGFFLEWRIADKHKRSLFEDVDFWLDTNVPHKPVMISKQAFQDAMTITTQRPFRLVPYFDPGVWGGQWMKAVMGMDAKQDNYAWSFDGVPEENSLRYRMGEHVIEFPAMNLTLSRPVAFMGEKVYARFGAEFPIRFDLLDTMGGQNLSLQVHPTTDFIRENYGMPYTQEESYYILDATDDAYVYLGVKNHIDGEAMMADLKRASHGDVGFDAEKYVNKIPAKKHDHFLIPPGVIHCSGEGCMVLEISASAYIFTFKLWDWDRVGLDGLPRPIHLEEGGKVLNYAYDTDVTMAELVNVFEPLETSFGHYKEKTGLHDLEFIETHRHSFERSICLSTDGNVRMMNLVGGEEVTISSPTHAFDDFVVHYAETFIIPASVDCFTMTPTGLSAGKSVQVLEAFVR